MNARGGATYCKYYKSLNKYHTCLLYQSSSQIFFLWINYGNEPFESLHFYSTQMAQVYMHNIVRISDFLLYRNKYYYRVFTHIPVCKKACLAVVIVIYQIANKIFAQAMLLMRRFVIITYFNINVFLVSTIRIESFFKYASPSANN